MNQKHVRLKKSVEKTGFEYRLDVASGDWVLMEPEDDYEDLSPIFSDEPYLTFKSEVNWLREMAENSSPEIQAAIEEQIKRMIAFRDEEMQERKLMIRDESIQVPDPRNDYAPVYVITFRKDK